MLNVMPQRIAHLKKEIVFVAGKSRILVFILQATFNFLPDHDAEAFKPNISTPINIFDATIRYALDGFSKWDAQYFLFVARQGYISEATFAFFPLWPFLIREVANIISFIVPFLSYYTCCLASAATLNFIFFIGATVFLFDLTQNIFGCPKFAFFTSYLFCFNPASIFFSSCYTESLYALCVFKALSTVTLQRKRSFIQLSLSTFWFIFAAATRSNGTINCGYIIYYLLEEVTEKSLKKQLSLGAILLFVLKALIYGIPILLPFILFNWYGFVKFCIHGILYSKHDISPELPVWCNKTIPIIYDHVQKENWGLGLFAYYQWKKLPNFLLAFPVIVLSIYSAYLYFSYHKHEALYCGLVHFKVKHKHGNFQFLLKNIFPYYFHLLFLITFALLFMHVEVTTRLVLSSTPIIYWTVASFIIKDRHASDITQLICWHKLGAFSKIFLVYFASYFLLGTLLHCNFLPWT